MKKYSILTFIVGLFIGATMTAGVVFAVILPKIVGQDLFGCISKIENMAYKIYLNGDFESSTIALEELKTELYEYNLHTKKDSWLYDTITTDLGLTHARLFVVYEKEGNSDLANQNYQKAIQLISNEFGVNSEEDLYSEQVNYLKGFEISDKIIKKELINFSLDL